MGMINVLRYGGILPYLLLALCLSGCAGQANAKTSLVKPHVTKRGTYVGPTMRSDPNKTKLDNYSTKGNVNPYSGKKGYKK